MLARKNSVSNLLLAAISDKRCRLILFPLLGNLFHDKLRKPRGLFFSTQTLLFVGQTSIHLLKDGETAILPL